MYSGNNTQHSHYQLQQQQHQQQQNYNDLNASFTSEGTDHSYDSDSTFHIYNELQFQQYQPTAAMPIQQQQNNSANVQNNNPATGIIYGFRTRHLSCIEENDSDSLHSSSLPPPYEMMKGADECFRKLVTEDIHQQGNRMTTWDDDVADGENTDTVDGAVNGEDEEDEEEGEEDNIAMIDESRLYDMDYLDELSASKNEVTTAEEEAAESFMVHQHEAEAAAMAGIEEYWQSTVSEPMHRRAMPPDIMTTSCYGALNSSFGSEMSGPPGYNETNATVLQAMLAATSTPTKHKEQQSSQQQRLESLYATPEKASRRECNRSFDSSCPSQSSSMYGGLEPINNFSMTSSLDLKCLSASASFVGGTSVLHSVGHSVPLELSVMSADGMRSEWGTTAGQVGASPAEEITDEMASKCLSAAESDLQSIRRLLENDASGSVCPSCRISFDKGKRRKLIDTCGHERCYSCMFRNDQCPMCMNGSLKDVDCNNAQGYDTGIGGSTSTIVSPLGSPQPQLRSQVQRTNAAALAKYMQHNQRHQESISPEYNRYASVGKLPKAAAAATHHNHTTVTADIHTGSSNHNNYSEINASSFATPPTRRRFFNHKNLRNALTGGHRRTASNGGGSCSVDTASILSGGKDSNALNTSTCSDSVVTRRRRKNVSNNVNASATPRTGSENRLNRLSLAGTSVYAGHLSSLVFGKIKSLWSVNSNSSDAGLNQLAGSDHNSNDSNAIISAEKQKDQLRARLGLLLDSDQNGGSNTNTTTSSSSSGSMQNNSPEQTLLLLANGNNGCNGGSGLVTTAVDNFGSQLSVAVNKDDALSLCGKFKTACALNATTAAGTAADNSNGYEPFPVKARKSVARRSARTAAAVQLSNGGAVAGSAAVSSKRNAIYKPTAANVQSPLPAAKQLALKPLFFEVPLQEPDPPFVGRQWLLRELSHILMATETPGVLINGNPGTGKTALILQLVEYSCFGRRKDAGIGNGGSTAAATAAAANNTADPDGIYCQINIGNERIRALASNIVGYHFCQADANATCLVPDFVHSLAAQLCQAPQLSAYREYLLNEPHLQDILSVKECIADAERVMRMAILEPLASLKRAGKIPAKTCVILVDALCEAEYHRPDHGQTIAMFLARMTQYFPAWLKLVATVRTQMLEFVKGLSYTKMTLDSWASNDLLQKDMLDYITFRVNHCAAIRCNIAGAVKDNSAGQLKFIGHMQALTRGSMLYAKLILDLIERGQLVIKSSSYKVLPVSLAQIFLLHFNLRFPTACSFERAAPILNVCLAALYPLTLNEIYYTICALKTADEVMSWDEFLARFKLLDGFLIKRIDNTYMFFHSSLREWLIRRDEGESAKFLCDFRLGHAAIAFRLSRLQAPLDAEQTLELGHHMLKAHIYRSSQAAQSPRDLQAHWVASVSANVSAALGALRNVYSPNLKVSRLILLAGASPHYRTEFMGDATILCIAAHEGIVPMVSLLLEFGADVRRTNSQGCTPLILAAMRGHCDVVRLLVAAGSSLGQTDTTQRCALVHAARTGRLNVVKYLLACDWTPRPASQDVSLAAALQQALIGAAAQDHVGILEDLLDMDGIDVDECERSSGDLALTAAARNGCADAVALLIGRGACVERRNRQGCPPLWLAVKSGHWAVAERLLQSGAEIDEVVTTARKTPLMCAAEEGHIELLELLLERGAALEVQDADGFTALSWAALRGRLGAARCLIERGGCDKQHADHNGRTALDLAAYQGSAALVLYLLEQGANIEHIDVNGMRPLDRAIACRNIQVVQVFLRRGAKLGPTTWSMAMGKPEILVVLLNKLLEDGNVLYRKNRFHEAAHRYQYALRKIASLESVLERSAIFAQLRTNLLLNLSRCKRKLNELDESIDLATQAIAQKPNSYEGYYARAKARMEHGELNEALVDANEAMQKAAQSGVLSEVIEVLKRIQAELLTRITNEDSGGAGGSKYAAEPSGATAMESAENEMTDL